MNEIVNLAARRFHMRSPDNPSYYTVRKSGQRWAVLLVTPNPGFREIKTTLGASPHRQAALDYARESAFKSGVPFMLKGVRQ